nr:hypothetical protein [Saprospiraceae bacterium]
IGCPVKKVLLLIVVVFDLHNKNNYKMGALIRPPFIFFPDNSDFHINSLAHFLINSFSNSPITRFH